MVANRHRPEVARFNSVWHLGPVSKRAYLLVVAAADFLSQPDSQVNNPLAHEYMTGPEIIEDMTTTPPTPSRHSSGKVDVFVVGAGTGGTITGISRALKKEHNPKCVVVGIDPVGYFCGLLVSKLLTLAIERKCPRLPRHVERQSRRRCSLCHRGHRIRLRS